MSLAKLEQLDLAYLFGLSVNDTIVTLATVGDLVSVHPGYQDKFPEEVPGPPELTTLGGELRQLDNEAVNKDTAKVALRDEKHEECAISLAVFGHFANMRAFKRKDPSYLENIGIPRKKKITVKSKATASVEAPDPFTVRHGPVSGSVIFRMGKVKGAAHYDVYYCLDNPNDEQSWILAATFINTRNAQVNGLTPGKNYMFRAHCLGAQGFGPYSTVIKIMVI